MIIEVTFEETDGLGPVLDFHDAKWDMQEMFGISFILALF